LRKLSYTYQMLLDTGGSQIQIKNNPDDYSIALLQLNQRLEGEPPDFLTLSLTTGLAKKTDMPARQTVFRNSLVLFDLKKKERRARKNKS